MEPPHPIHYHVDMDWITVLGSLVAIVVGILVVGEFIDRSRTEKATEDLGSWLSGREGLTSETWVQKVNVAFLSAYDWAYSVPREKWKKGFAYSRDGTVLTYLWLGLVVAPIILLGIRVGFWILGVSAPDTNNLLLISIGMALSNISIGSIVWVWRVVKDKRENISMASSLPAMFIPACVTILLLIVFGVRESIVWWIILSAGLAAGSTMVLGTVGGAIFASGYQEPDKWRVHPHPVDPSKALISSLFFIVLVGLIQGEAGLEIIRVLKRGEFAVLAFVAFNIFADAISLVETRWILTRGAQANLGMLAGLLLLDLILSAAIFLIIPTILWELPDFWEAIRFDGPRPWLGILFWTTFSTSAMFYLFVAAVLFVRPMVAITNVLSRWKFDLSGHPIRCISVAVSIEVAALFIIGIAVSAVLR